MNQLQLLENRLFFTSVYSTELDINIDQLVSLALEQSYIDRQKCTGKQTNNFLLYDHPQIIPLFKDIQIFVNEITERWGIAKKLKVKNYWFNIHEKGHYGNSHYHREGIISGVLYLKSPQDCGKIVFERTDLQEHYFEADNVTEYSYKNYSYEPKVGRLLLFPSYLKHRIESNNTKDDDDKRISLSFNYV
jgi:uncharacterized protein (TIGR02466 family)